MADQNTKIINEETKEEEQKTEKTPAAFDAQAYQTTVDTIKRIMGMITETKKQIKELKESFESVLANDPTYQEHLKAAKEATKIKNKTKQEIMKRPEAATVVAKIKDLAATLKENQKSLSENLVSYINVAGVNEIEDENGVPHQITFTAKLKPLSSRK